MPWQFALSNRSGTEAVVRALTLSTELNRNHTIISVDGIGAYDHMSKSSMLSALAEVPEANRCLPFVQLFHTNPSQYVWYDANGSPHVIHQAEGGEQGDPLLPALYCLGKHAALAQVQHQLQRDERL